MATLLTTSWQKISTIGLTYGEIRTYAKYSKQDTGTNKTVYQMKMTYYTWQANGVTFSSASGTLDGYTSSWGYSTIPKGESTMISLEREITHNTDGSSPTKTINTSWSATFGGSGSTSAQVTFPKINRYPMITSATNFNDEENPTITYSTISGFSGATYSMCIALAGSNRDDIPYRSVNLDDGSYTFNFTSAEREILRNSTPNNNSTTARFILKTTTSGGTNYYSEATRTLTIVNGNPTFTHSEVETTQKVIDVLGSSSASTIVQNASVVRMTIVPTALKGSSIASVSVSSGLEYSKTITASPYVFDIPVVSTGSFVITVTDSRGNQGGTAVSKNLINYQNVDITSFSFERENPTSSNVFLTLEARYYQITVGSTTNAPVFKWKLEESGTYATIPSSAYNIDTTNNKVTITNYQLSNVLSHELSGQFFVSMDDIFSSDNENMIVNKGIATYEAGEFDFQVNGDLIVADTEAENGVNILEEINKLQPTILYDNTSGTTGTITLSQNVSNFSYIEFIYGKGRPEASTKVLATSEYAVLIDYSTITGGPQIGVKKVRISGTSVTHANGYYLNFTSSGVSTGSTNEISIYRVLGWR